MDRQSISRPGMKHRRANSLPNQAQRLLPEKVNISDDTWLEALKFMTWSQWMQKRYVSPQIKGIAERNVLRLPKMVIDSATMYYMSNARNEELEKLPMNTIIAFDTVMQEEQSTKWFMERGFTLDDPVNILAENAINGGKEWTSGLDSNVHMCILGPSQEKIPLSEEEKHQPWFYHLPDPEKYRKPVLYYAQFNPLLNDYSWNYLVQFLKFIYHPESHIKEIGIFVNLNQKFIDSLKCNVDSIDNAPRYIRCQSFSMQTDDKEHEIAVLSNSLKWLSRNVRAENLYIEIGEDEFDLFANFILDPSGAKQCASKKLEFDMDHSSIWPFFVILMTKLNEMRSVGSTNLMLSLPDKEGGSPDAGLLYVSQDRKLVPTPLGIALVKAFRELDQELVLPTMRAEVERSLSRIASGEAERVTVRDEILNVHKEKMLKLTQNFNKVENSFKGCFPPRKAREPEASDHRPFQPSRFGSVLTIDPWHTFGVRSSTNDMETNAANKRRLPTEAPSSNKRFGNFNDNWQNY